MIDISSDRTQTMLLLISFMFVRNKDNKIIKLEQN